MKVKINYASTAPKNEVIDLQDFGHLKNTKWSDLSYREQVEITDSLVEEYNVTCEAEDAED